VIHVQRQMAIIDAAQRVGFTLEEIRDLLGCGDCGLTSTSVEVQRYGPPQPEPARRASG